MDHYYGYSLGTTTIIMSKPLLDLDLKDVAISAIFSVGSKIFKVSMMWNIKDLLLCMIIRKALSHSVWRCRCRRLLSW